MRKAVSSMIAYVLIALVSTTALIITLTALAPAFDNAKSTSTLSDAFQNLNTLDSAIRTIASESHGSKRTVPLAVSDGTYGINATNDWLYFEYVPNENLALGGTKGNVHVEQGLDFADYFNSYTSGSTASPTWTNASGQWAVSDSGYLGQTGIAYHNVYTLENWKFSATITNVSGLAAGEVFALPTDPASLALYWTFDEGSGTKTYDYSGNRNNGTLTNMNTTGNATSGWTTSCKYGKCLLFDGVNDYISATSVPLNTAAGGYNTASFWMYWNGQTGKIPFNLGATYYDLWIPSSVCMGFNTGSSDAYGITNLSAVNKNWAYVTLIFYNGAYTGNNKIYINGVDQSLVQCTGTAKSGTAGSTIYMGLLTPGTGYYFNGTMDEVMIFNRSLTNDEVTALYETTTKKLNATGVQSVAIHMNVSLVLSSPAGQTKFDDVTVTSGGNDITMIVPYDGIDINGTLRVGKGQHQIEILNMGVNATSNRQVVQVRAA